MLSFIMLLFVSSMSHAQSISPGEWQSDSSVKVNGISLPATQEKECLSAGEAKDIRKTITKELERSGCSPTKWVVKGSQVEIALKCAKSDLEAEGNMRGIVRAKSYALNGEANGTFRSIPSQATIGLKGKWLRSCKQ